MDPLSYETLLENFFKLSERQLSPCLSNEPLAKLGTGQQGAILNYNLPQSTAFKVKGYMPLDIPDTYFKASQLEEPSSNFWTNLANYTTDEVEVLLSISRNTNLGTRSTAFEDLVKEEVSVKEGLVARHREEKREIPTSEKFMVEGKSLADMAKQINNGYRPVMRRNFYGKEELIYQAKPPTPQPRLYIVEHYKIASYLGDYGAGKTLKTFSLLPGEKTEITIRSFKQRESTRTKSENILDSFSESSAKEMERLLKEESESSNTESTENNTVLEANVAAQFGGSLSIPIKVVNLQLSGGINNSTNRKNTKTTNSARENSLKALNSAMNRHTEESSAVREVTVNTEVTETERLEEETTIVRTLENINHSRVLNFVFRQLIQEYFTITYLDDVSIVYTNGYPESNKIAKLDNIEGLLTDILADAAKVTEVKDKIINSLCSIYDYQGTRQRFVEAVNEDIYDINDTVVESLSYIRKRSDLAQVYAHIGKDVTVPGIILDVTHRMLRTDSLIVDAVLGQGEALDCFNVKLQEAANMKAYLESYQLYLEGMEHQQALRVIEGIEDPITKAEWYKKVHSDCCTSNVIVPHAAINDGEEA